jgi:hypothetical protein
MARIGKGEREKIWSDLETRNPREAFLHPLFSGFMDSRFFLPFAALLIILRPDELDRAEEKTDAEA